jgi:uncharacterized protein YjbI with pentapeptide repeats
MEKQSLEKAIAQLAETEIQTRLTAIYQLEKIADSQQYRWQVVEALTNFARNNALANEQEFQTLLPICMDTQAAVSIICRNAKQNRENHTLDLSYVDMRGANLDDANLERAILYKTNLAGASLNRANLHKAVLTAANLAGASLKEANLQQAIMGAANLAGTDLSYANLYQTNLFLANLHGATLDSANLCSANLREANLSNTRLELAIFENKHC